MKKFSAKFSVLISLIAGRTCLFFIIAALSFVVTILWSQNANCQSYYYQLSYGIDDKTFEWGWNGYMKTIWDSGPEVLNDTLSPAQPIPFSWKFYGKNVTHYKISDNGYITFDTASTVSYPNNTTLPNAGGPNKAIYVFWRDFEIGANGSNPLYDHVVSWTYGKAPNRIHVIEWQSISTRNNTTQLNAAYFAVRLYEGGDFDIVHIWGRYNNAAMAGGTVGVENEDGTLGTMTVKSPNESMKISYIKPEDVPVYKYVYGAQPQYDVACLKLVMPPVVKAGMNILISGELINYGSKTISSLDLNYQVDNDSIKTQHINNLNFTNNSIYTFNNNVPWKTSGAGQMHYISAWASNLDGNNDELPKNDTAKGVMLVNNGISAEKKALIEEFSTAPCGFCPDGLYITQKILDNNPNAIGFTHHAGYLTDSMTIPESKTFETIFGTGAPMAAIDRILWPGERNINISRGNNNWENRMAGQLMDITPVNVSIITSYNNENRNINITATAKLIDYAFPGDLRMNVYVIEDSVTGEGSGYAQTNYYSKDAPNGPAGSFTHPFYNLPYKIEGFVHRHVLRAIPSGIWGTAGIIPAFPEVGKDYSQSYSYTAPSNIKMKDISIIAFVSYYDSNYKDIHILNAEEQKLETTGIVDSNISQEISITPNPVTDYICILGSRKYERIEIFSSYGVKVLETMNINRINVSWLSQGMYFIKIDENLLKFIKI